MLLCIIPPNFKLIPESPKKVGSVMLSLRNWKYFRQNVDISSPNISSNRHVPRQGKNRWKYINNTLNTKSLAPWRCVSKCERLIFHLITPIGNFEQVLWMCFQEITIEVIASLYPRHSISLTGNVATGARNQIFYAWMGPLPLLWMEINSQLFARARSVAQ